MVGKPTKRRKRCGGNNRGGREYATERKISRTVFEPFEDKAKTSI
jgi:hypothetical protein